MKIFKAKAKQLNKTFDAVYKSENGKLFIKNPSDNWNTVYQAAGGYSYCSEFINPFRIQCVPVVRDSAPQIRMKEPTDGHDVFGAMEIYG